MSNWTHFAVEDHINKVFYWSTSSDLAHSKMSELEAAHAGSGHAFPLGCHPSMENTDAHYARCCEGYEKVELT